MPGGGQSIAAEKILIVDGDAAVRLPVIQALRSLGFGVVTADDAVSAVSVALRERPAAILLELRLPAGDGYQVMQRLQTLPATAGTPVIVCTGLDPGRHEERSLAAGAVEFLPKPVTKEALAATLRFVFGPGLGLPAEARHPSGPRTILVVDDDPDVRRALLLLLKAQGYDVVTSEDAISAMTLAVARVPDVVILDVGLPGGEGFVVMERLRGVPNLAATPVIVISGREPTAIRKRAEEMGAVAFLRKPTDNRLLLEAVRAALGDEAA
jgi:DNA-binding response OmpR family regulator